MIDHNTPIAPDAVRIIVQDGEHRMVSEHPVAHLDKILDFSATGEHLAERTTEGTLKACAIYRTAMRTDNELVACAAAMWICLYGGDLPDVLRGLRLSDLQGAAGNGTLTIGTVPDLCRWQYLFTNKGREYGGTVTVDAPGWAKGSMGSA